MALLQGVFMFKLNGEINVDVDTWVAKSTKHVMSKHYNTPIYRNLEVTDRLNTLIYEKS